MPVPEVNGRPAPAGSAGVLPTLFGVGYGAYQVRRETFVVSFLLHVVAVVLIVVSGSFVYTHREEIKQQVTGIVTDISPYVLPPASTKAGGGGGGGDRDKLAASKGALPKSSREQVAPPAAVIRNLDPKLPVTPTVVVPPNIPLPHIGPLGDPLSAVLGPPSNGTGSGGGIGSGSGGGVGSGRGPGVGPGWGGGIGGGPYRVGGGVSAPKPLFTPDPEYSEEARKSKYQGVVVLWLVIGSDGLPQEIKVARPLGMGLDEKAIEAVRTWRFKPAEKDGRPVAVQMNVEVSFRLY
ncbi:MAG TPA: energy transducer TonB [Bryobacteraceae bacterium]|nr:energy transducer TonB [Bryobacteraceae bacterium]